MGSEHGKKAKSQNKNIINNGYGKQTINRLVIQNIKNTKLENNYDILNDIEIIGKMDDFDKNIIDNNNNNKDNNIKNNIDNKDSNNIDNNDNDNGDKKLFGGFIKENNEIELNIFKEKPLDCFFIKFELKSLKYDALEKNEYSVKVSLCSLDGTSFKFLGKTEVQHINSIQEDIIKFNDKINIPLYFGLEEKIKIVLNCNDKIKTFIIDVYKLITEPNYTIREKIDDKFNSPLLSLCAYSYPQTIFLYLNVYIKNVENGLLFYKIRGKDNKDLYISEQKEPNNGYIMFDKSKAIIIENIDDFAQYISIELNCSLFPPKVFLLDDILKNNTENNKLEINIDDTQISMIIDPIFSSSSLLYLLLRNHSKNIEKNNFINFNMIHNNYNIDNIDNIDNQNYIKNDTENGNIDTDKHNENINNIENNENNKNNEIDENNNINNENDNKNNNINNDINNNINNNNDNNINKNNDINDIINANINNDINNNINNNINENINNNINENINNDINANIKNENIENNINIISKEESIINSLNNNYSIDDTIINLKNLNKIKLNLDLNFCIDFSFYNGDVTKCSCYHYIEKKTDTNFYLKIITKFLSVFNYLNYDNGVGLYGYGFEFKSGVVLNKNFSTDIYPMSENPMHPYIYSNENTINAYKDFIKRINFSEKWINISKIFEYFNELNEEYIEETYNICIIITCKDIDKENTKNLEKAMIKSQYKPLSFIIIGLGKDKFFSYKSLHKTLIDYNFEEEGKTYKNIRQNYAFFETSRYGNRADIIVKEVCKSINEHIIEYYEVLCKGIIKKI